MRSLLVTSLLTLGLSACEGERRERPFGSECRSDRDCESHLCVSETRSTRKGFCSESCASSDECPNGYSCAGVTRKRIVVCTKSTGVPFMDAQRKAEREAPR